MKNKMKKILKIFLKVFITLLVVYVIYVVVNIIYANSIIDKLVKAVEKADTRILYSFNNDSIDDVGKYIKDSEKLKKLKNFSYEKVKTRYYLGKVRFEYDIRIANPESVFENGMHIQNLIENFDDMYINERQIQKEVAKKTGEYNFLEEYYYTNDYSIESIDTRTFSDLTKREAFKDENEYDGNDFKIINLQIEYNVFTHEFENLDYFYKIKSGHIFSLEIKKYFDEKYIENGLYYISMFKQGEKPITIISLNEKFVSLFEEYESSYVRNQLERNIIVNKLSMEKVEEYLLDEGYVYGTVITLVNSEEKLIYLAFNGDKLLYMDDEENTENVQERMNEYIQNNIAKDIILNELENEGYYYFKN